MIPGWQILEKFNGLGKRAEEYKKIIDEVCLISLLSQRLAEPSFLI
jgi:hypothetical protein